MNETIVEKIRKCLQLSAHNSSEAESALALAKAKKIAAENDIDISLIEIFTKVKKNEPMVKNEGINLGRRKKISQRFVSWIIQRHFGCHIVYSGGRNGGINMFLIGTKDKIEIATYVQNFLNSEFQRLWDIYYAKTNCRLEEKASYFLGLYNGLSDKLDKEQEQVVTEKLESHSEDTRNQFALMVVNEKERLKEAVNQFFPRLRHAAHYQAKSYSSNVINDGIVAGQNINIRRSISNGCADNRIAA